jgi:hypothetical protein
MARLRRIASLALATAGALLIIVSVPPWFNRIFGEEYAFSWQGAANGIAQVAIAGAMLAGIRLAATMGALVAAVSLAVCIWLLLAVIGGFESTMWLMLSAALYALVLLAVLLDRNGVSRSLRRAQAAQNT